jgi:hypothetical protein
MFLRYRLDLKKKIHENRRGTFWEEEGDQREREQERILEVCGQDQSALYNLYEIVMLKPITCAKNKRNNYKS